MNQPASIILDLADETAGCPLPGEDLDPRRTRSPRRRSVLISMLAVAIILGSVTMLYRNVVGHFFYFDDFSFLSTPMPSSVAGFLEPLDPRRSNAIGFYRPITTVYYFIGYKSLFGLNPVPYMATNLLALLVNVLLVFLIVRNITGSTLAGGIAAQLYGVNFIHIEALSWAAGIQEEAFALFSLAAVLSYLLWTGRGSRGTGRPWLLWSSILFYVLALLSKETAVVLPVWLALYVVVTHVGRLDWRSLLSRVAAIQWPYFAILTLYLGLRARSVAERATGNDVYAFRGIGAIAVHLVWFTRWALDEFLYPIELAKQAVAPRLHLGTAAWLAVGLLAIAGGAAVVAFSVLSMRRRVSRPRDEALRIGVLGLAWFVIGLLPVSLWLDQAAYYLVLPAVGFYMVAAYMLRGILNRIAIDTPLYAVAVGILIWGGTTWGAFQRVGSLEMTGAPSSGRIAEQTLSTLKTAHPTLPAGTRIYLVDFPAQVWPGNSAREAVRLFYGGAPVDVVIAADHGAGDQRITETASGNVYAVKYDGGRVLVEGDVSSR